MFKVRKKSGELEEYNRDKVVEGVVHAGASLEEAERVAAEIDAWLPQAVAEGVVDSSQIRGKVIEILRPVNQIAAGDYEGFQKPATA